ncbi:amino acid transporter [Candidatus Francisella endociliophora]|uniref:Amino acid transporter n=1 Tax=Candidatus Francisella endociliophora TaxID=653937 RepID=A0A097EMY3_9GAMM|nr:APC family permease [Francisella sp. FSC1006]AIT08927.1 amino acid transporter [Francisella sp. FSC1006]
MSSHNLSKISLFGAILLSVTTMIGSGYLFSAQLTANYAGNWSFLAWIFTAIIVIATGFCYSKVVVKYPVRGATTRISSISHNNIFAIPFAFANWFGIVVFVTSEALATVQYLAGIKSMSWIMHEHKLTHWGIALSAIVLVIYLLINSYGVKWLTRINNGVTLFKIIVPSIIIFIFLYVSFFDSSTSNFVTKNIPGNVFHFKDTFIAIVAGGLVYTFNGFQTIASYASEIENPKRNIPLAIVISVLVVLLVYMGLQYAFMQALPHQYLVEAGGWRSLNFESPLLQLAAILGLNYIVILLIINSVVSPSGAGFAYLGSSSRMLYGLAEEGQAPKYFTKINEEFNFSRRSLIANFLLTLSFLIFADNWSTLMLIVTGFNIIGYMAAPISMGAIFQKTRIYGCIVFVVLAMILATLRFNIYMLIMLILLILILIFFIRACQKEGFVKALIYSLPFPVFMGLLIFVQDYYIKAILSVVFYMLVTTPKYVAICSKNKLH